LTQDRRSGHEPAPALPEQESDTDPALRSLQREIFDLYCRLLALDQKVKETEEFSAGLRAPFEDAPQSNRADDK
jgi:hypothetical protein